ncbi:MAG: AAA family ATPase, partial [Lachnospiraceae bacterium]
IPEPVQEIEPEVIPAVKAIRKEASKVISPQVKEVVPERIISEEAKQQELDFDEYMQNSMENLSQELNKTEAVTATAEINVQDVIATMAAKIDDLQEQKSKDNYFEDQIKPQQVSVENLKNQIEPEEMAEVEDVEEFYDEPEENGLFDDPKENSYFDELEENDFFDEPEEAPKQLEADAYEEESYDDDFEESLSEALEAEKAPSRKAIAKAAATGKTAKLPLEEIAALTGKLPQDTGFIVTGRYDLDAQSEVGLRAGLTEEQKKLFSYFVPVRGMSEQLVDVLEQDKQCTNREGTSKTGNLLIIGRKGSGKTVLAVDVVKAIQKGRNIKQGKVAIVTGESLNRKKVSDITNKLYGGALIIEKASGMNEKTVIRLNKAMERDTGELLIVLEEQRKPLDVLLSSNKEFRRKFTSRLEVPIFINDELVTFGQTYAKENGYKIDEMGILALYSRIDVLQREDHAVTVAEVKDIMDEAVEHSQKTNMKKFVKRVFGKNTDDSDRIILTENDFNI